MLLVTAEPIVGAPGTVTGTTTALILLAAPAPAEFTAFAVKVYGVPFVNPLTVIRLDELEALIPVLLVAVYVMGNPPVSVGALIDTFAKVFALPVFTVE
jgi:hypothetical protein